MGEGRDDGAGADIVDDCGVDCGEGCEYFVVCYEKCRDVKFPPGSKLLKI
jgi:hypothetical protein